MQKVGLLAVMAIFFHSTTLWAAEGCTVNAIQGSATVLRSGQKAEVKPGDSLSKGDILETGPDCQLDMSMNDLAGCRLLADTTVEVAAWKQENMTLKVLDGNLILNLKTLPAEAVFKVETPTAIAAVRGTQFWGRVNRPTPDHPVTTFAVREGSVSVTPQGSDQAFLLQPGQALDLKSGETPAVRQALPAEMQAMEQASGIPTAV